MLLAIAGADNPEGLAVWGETPAWSCGLLSPPCLCWETGAPLSLAPLTLLLPVQLGVFDIMLVYPFDCRSLCFEKPSALTPKRVTGCDCYSPDCF